ncbi:kinase-like protein [Rickenella mellea]|uniref:Kinase-like protein n=1 Tax=Rickenella mellea TaxID=50990 RepID=A0A4Y7Q6U1_9AGAM|nr:kinase-like protein [Rickenella mellea]
MTEDRKHANSDRSRFNGRVEADVKRFEGATGRVVIGVDYHKNMKLLEKANNVVGMTRRGRSENFKTIALMANPDGTSVDPKNDDGTIIRNYRNGAGHINDCSSSSHDYSQHANVGTHRNELYGNGDDKSLERIASLTALILQDLSNYPSEAEKYLDGVIQKLYKKCALIRDTVGDSEAYIPANKWLKNTQNMFKHHLSSTGKELYEIESEFKDAREKRTHALAPLISLTGSTQRFIDEYGVEATELNVDTLTKTYSDKAVLVDKFKIVEIQGLPSSESKLITKIGDPNAACGLTYKVEDAEGKPYVVKHIRADGKDATTCLRYIREVRAWRLLNHKNILPFHGMRPLFFKGRFPGLVSQWCNGGDITAYLEAHPDTTMETRLFFVSEAAEGLNHLHSKGIIHNDLKAQNIVIHENGRNRQVYVCDFGSSRVMDNVRGTTTSRACSALFLAPEVALKLAPQSPASDIFSFGCVFLQVLYNETPYHDLSSDELKQARKDGKGPETYFTQPLMESVPADSVDFMTGCWDAVPSRRYSASEVVKHLEYVKKKIIVT